MLLTRPHFSDDNSIKKNLFDSFRRFYKLKQQHYATTQNVKYALSTAWETGTVFSGWTIAKQRQGKIPGFLKTCLKTLIDAKNVGAKSS